MPETTYEYDGNGRRVRKVLAGVSTTVYIYDAQGQLAAEFDTAANPESGTQYVTADHLGSTRMVTDANGLEVKRYDYLPFGEEIPAGEHGRTGPLWASGIYPSSPNGIPLRFTGKQRDAETGLDYFGARYFSGSQGRFTSPDPENASGFLYPDDPQSWNGYAYGRNNTLKYVDPDGLAYRVCQIGEDGKEFNCGTVKDDRAFEKYAKAQDWTLKSGKLLDQSGNVVGAAHYFNPEPMEALIMGTQRADAMIKDAAKTMAVNAAMTATGVVALRGLGYAGQAAQELGVFKNTKVVVNFAHQLMKVRPKHLPPPGGEAEVQQAVKGAIQTGNYVLKADGLIEGTTQINGVVVGFRGRFVDGVARIATVFTKR